MNKQLTLSLISDELAQASTLKKEFLAIMDKIIPWSEWVGMIKPCYYKEERGNFLKQIVEKLRRCNLILQKGTIVDSTLIAAPSSTKKQEGGA